jgi:hypothetical protein
VNLLFPKRPTMGDLRLVEEQLRFKFYFRDQLGLAYNKGHRAWGDMYLSRPNWFPVYSPSGRPVTTNHAYRFNHHKSIFLGHARVNGVNFFHDNSPNRRDLGDIAFEGADIQTSDTSILLCTRNGWIAKEGARILTEKRDIRWTPGEDAHVLDINSVLTSDAGEVVFGKDTHAYLGVRVADTMDVEDGGRALNSNGHVNEEECMNQFADWVDYSGSVVGKVVGVTLMHHPVNPPSPYFVRNYGTFLSNFTLREPYTLGEGGSLELRFRILIHEGSADDVDIARYHREFVASPYEPRRVAEKAV